MASFRRALHAFKSATSLSGARPAYAAGIRGSIATVVPLAVAQLLELDSAGTWMSLGGFNGALSDRGGSYRTRALTMLALMGTGAVVAALGAIVGGHFVASLVATFIVAFAASVLRVWGNPGVSVGTATLSVYAVALAIPASHSLDALERAGYLVVGALWAMGIALVLWPLRPYRPARVAVAASYAALADYVEQLATASAMQDTTEWPVQQTPGAITNVRTALENARTVLVQLRRGRPGAAERGERLLVLGESADQLFGHVAALGETLSAIRGAARSEHLHAICIDTMREIAKTARAVGVEIEMESSTEPIPVRWSGTALRAAIAAIAPQPVDPQYAHAAVILDRAAQFASAASVTAELLNGGDPDAGVLAATSAIRSPSAAEPETEDSWLDFFRAMLSPGSLIARFAARVAVVTTVAVALTQLLELKRGYWVTITVIVILQPYTGVTFTRAAQRVMGTVLGALLAAALGAYFHDPRAILVIATIFVACCIALLPLNYAAFSVFLTPTWVLLAEASAGDWNLAETRVLNTLLGGTLALLGARLLWPSPESRRFPAYASAALRANAEYLRTVVARYDDRSHEAGEVIRAARRAIGLATVNAEESVQRVLTEAHGDARRLAPPLTLLAYTRRLTASIAALALARHADDGTSSATLEPFTNAVISTLTDLADALDEGRPPLPQPESASLPETPSALISARVERLSRQTATLHDTVARMSRAGVASREAELATV
jgi:uncharacterized membrane protein YccC